MYSVLVFHVISFKCNNNTIAYAFHLRRVWVNDIVVDYESNCRVLILV
jgi:hypothetical protein